MTSLLVPHAASSAGQVRRALVRELCAAGVPEPVVDDAVLVMSELVGNAVRHGAPVASSDCIRVSWWVAGGAVHLEVCDGGPGLDDAGLERAGAVQRDFGRTGPHLTSLSAEGGRGLPIVDLLTSRWGTTARSPRGVVGIYAELPLPGQVAHALSRGAAGDRRRTWTARTSPGSAWPAATG